MYTVFSLQVLECIQFLVSRYVKGRGEGMGWDGREGEGMEVKWRRGVGKGGAGQEGEGLVNFHLTFQKTWAEPDNPRKYIYKVKISVCGYVENVVLHVFRG